jgi:methyl-accepting chemotaxis protein
MTPMDTLAARLTFNKIDGTSRALLRELRPVVMKALPGVLDEFYAAILEYPEIRKFFPNPSIANHAKAAQLAHWDVILSAKFDQQYVQSVTRIGETHHRLGLEPRWYIGGYNRIVSGIIRHIETSMTARFPSKSMYEKKAAMINAFVSAAMLDMDFAISVYLDAGKREKKETLGKLAARFEQTVAQIVQRVATMSDNLKAAATALKTTAADTQKLSTSVAATSDTASTNVQSVASGAEEMGSSVSEISRQVQESRKVAGDAVRQADGANNRITDLSKAAGRIGDVIKMINAIAEQTNLLALNATIEAARAGESGKGFAVVAQEVKALASQTAKATEEISSQINEMQVNTRETVAAISEISETIGSISRIATAISTAVEQQDAATQEISRGIHKAATGAAKVAANILELNKGAEGTEQAAANVHQSAQTLAKENLQLKTGVDDFLKALQVA